MPTPRIVPFAVALGQISQTPSEIENRLTRFLMTLRARGDSDRAQGEDEDRPAPLDRQDTARIRQRAQRLVARRGAASGQKQLRKGDLDELRPILPGVTLQGPATEHAADEIAATLLAEMPWHARVLEILWRDMRAAAREGLGLRFAPVLMDGSPGVGKTHLALRLARLAAVPLVHVDVATVPEGFALAGAQRTWASSAPGRPLAAILRSRIGNPLVFVDEVDKGATVAGRSGVQTSAHLALLSLLEPVSARAWDCPYYGTAFDMSHVNWLLASNDARLLPAPLRSRVRVVAVRGPTPDELVTFAEREAVARDLDPGTVDALTPLIRAYRDGDPRMSLRVVLRLLDEVEKVMGHARALQ